MKMISNLHIKRYPKQYLLIPILSFVGAWLVKVFLQDTLYNSSIDLIIRTQNEIKKIFNKEPEDDCFARDIFFGIFTLLSSNYFYFFFLALIYNFVNVYKAFVLALSIYIGNLISALLGLIYHQPRPFMVNYNIYPYIKEGEWGQPSPQIIIAISFYCSLWKIVCTHRPLENKTCKKIIIGLLFIIFLIALVLVHFASGLISFDQLIVSFLLGITVFSFMFFIFDLNVNNPSQFYGIVKMGFRYTFILDLILIAFIIILYRYIDYKEDKEYYEGHLDIQFNKKKEDKAGGAINFDNLKKNLFYSFPLSQGTFTNALCFLSNIFAVLALKIEAIISYEKDFDKWKKENFDDKSMHENVNFSITEYKYSTSTQWNHTSFGKVFCRCIFCLVLNSIPFLFFFIPFGDFPEAIKFIIFSFAIFSYYSFGIFFLFKKVYSFFGLKNTVVAESLIEED